MTSVTSVLWGCEAGRMLGAVRQQWFLGLVIMGIRKVAPVGNPIFCMTEAWKLATLSRVLLRVTQSSWRGEVGGGVKTCKLSLVTPAGRCIASISSCTVEARQGFNCFCILMTVLVRLVAATDIRKLFLLTYTSYWECFRKQMWKLIRWSPSVQGLRHDDVLVRGGIAPRILNPYTWCRWVVSLTPRALYARGNPGVSIGWEEPAWTWCQNLGRPARNRTLA
jgi:hypothetical protein